MIIIKLVMFKNHSSIMVKPKNYS